MAVGLSRDRLGGGVPLVVRDVVCKNCSQREKYFNEARYEGVEWIHLAHDSVQWPVRVNTLNCLTK
jgi:hypothetical protein